MENKIHISLKVNYEFDTLYKLGYFLIDINSILTFADKINKQTKEQADKLKKYKYGITSRILNKDSLKNIKIEYFQQGSLIIGFILDVFKGAILLLLGKYINQNQNKPLFNVTINNNTQINFNPIINITNNYNIQNPIEKDIDSLIIELNKNTITNENGLLYDKTGKKILIKNIERIKGQIINNKW